MKRRLIFASAVSLALVSMAGEAGAQTCAEIVGNRTYRCDFKFSGGEFDACFQFTAPGAEAPIDLFFEGGGANAFFACDCQPDGPFGNPRFGVSRKLECVGTTEVDVVVSLASKKTRPEGFRLTGINEFGTTFLARCQQDNQCTTVPPANKEEAPSGVSAGR